MHGQQNIKKCTRVRQNIANDICVMSTDCHLSSDYAKSCHRPLIRQCHFLYNRSEADTTAPTKQLLQFTHKLLLQYISIYFLIFCQYW